MTGGASGTATHAPVAKRRRRWHPALRVTVLLLAVVGCAALVEIGFRLFWPLPPWFAEFGQAGMYVDAGEGHVALRPGHRGTLVVDRPTTIVINSRGMRGPEVGDERAGERRVLVVGDSMVWGYGVDAEQTLPARIEAALRTSLGDVTVGNGGVPGYGSKHMAAQLGRMFAPFGADAAVVCACLGNDAMDEMTPERTVFAGLMLQGAWSRLVKESWRARLMYRSRAWLWLEAWLHTNQPEASLVTQLTFLDAERDPLAGFPKGRTMAGLFLDAVDELSTWEKGAPPVLPRVLAQVRQALLDCKAAVGERPLLFVTLPTSWQVVEARRVEKLRELGFDPTQFERGLAQRRWLQVATDLGIVALDATPILAAEPEPMACFLSDGGHFNERGNDVVGRWLAGELQARWKP